MIEKVFSLTVMQKELAVESMKQELRACNAYSEQFGLTLRETELTELAEARSMALRDSGRLEFASGILPKLIYAFSSSPYMEKQNYAVTLAELQEAFYFFKNDSMDLFTDDELIELMVKVFNGRAKGSAEYLCGISIDLLCHYADKEYESEEGDLF